MIAAFLENNWSDAQTLYDSAKKSSPLRALKILESLSSYVLPRMAAVAVADVSHRTLGQLSDGELELLARSATDVIDVHSEPVSAQPPAAKLPAIAAPLIESPAPASAAERIELPTIAPEPAPTLDVSATVAGDGLQLLAERAHPSPPAAPALRSGCWLPAGRHQLNGRCVEVAALPGADNGWLELPPGRYVIDEHVLIVGRAP